VGALARIERDVIAHKPTVVTLLFGMNDGLYKEFDPAVFKNYTDGLSEIIHRIKNQTHARIYVMTPTVFDGTRPTPRPRNNQYNDVLDKYSDAAKEIAKRENLPVIDLHTATVNALKAAKKEQSDYTFVDDGVHPGPDGQAVMAAEIVRAWGAPEGGEVLTQRAELKNASASFAVMAPLPWPAPGTSERIRTADPLMGRVGSITLKITGLPRGVYRLLIDALPGDSYSTAQLEAGVPIGTLSKKAQEASAQLAKAVRDKEDVEYMRWREIQLRFDKLKATVNAEQALDALAKEANELAREKAQLRKYEITLLTDFDQVGNSK
jgi:hypothetical protein